MAERKKIGKLVAGESAVTGAYALPAKFIIHTVGPVWKGRTSGEFDKLESCYQKSLLLAEKLGCASIAFPLISTGVYGFPKDKALQIALRTIEDFLKTSEMEVTLVVFDRQSFELSAHLLTGINKFIDEHYVKLQQHWEYAMDTIRWTQERSAGAMMAAEPPAVARSLEEVMNHIGETFQECLLRRIDERGMEDTAVYKRANIDRKLFSKIRCNPDYRAKSGR